ncbi:hypothetical protein [Haloarchaeobius litoreus]|uniref:DUF5658 domain-containing protein n=1 Tax=Haloarchaeobius litoreus TaxID=755306 RepID=A0ABD6DMT8_9EURY|nr:hypothetical protein [Haloarchaeobius litoreus]
MSTKTFQSKNQTQLFPRFHSFVRTLESHSRALWAAITALAVGDAASTYAALSLARELSESNPRVGEVNPATKGYLELVDSALSAMGVTAHELTLASLFPRVLLVLAILYAGYRILPSDYRALALPVYASTLGFAVVNNTMLAIPLYERLVWDSGFHIMIGLFVAGTAFLALVAVVSANS